MSDSASRLPARASLEQLQKQAKELLRQYRAGESTAIERFRTASPRPDDPELPQEATLAGAQFAIAREYGFESWAKLKHHVAALRPSGVEPFERLANDLAAAYSSADRNAVRQVNSDHGTSFGSDFHELQEMHRCLTTWFASGSRTPDLALADAQQMVAHSYGFESWAAFAASVS